MPAFHMWVLALLLLIPVSAKGTEKNSEKQPKSSLGSYHPCDRPSPSSRLLALGQWINMESQYLSLHLSNRRKQASRHMQAAVTCWALCYLHGAVISTFPQLAFWWDSGSELPCSFKKKKRRRKREFISFQRARRMTGSVLVTLIFLLVWPVPHPSLADLLILLKD